MEARLKAVEYVNLDNLLLNYVKLEPILIGKSLRYKTLNITEDAKNISFLLPVFRLSRPFLRTFMTSSH